jgi:nitrate reductase assembly molybdenum cofactor insertion protein NarJ
MIARHAEKNPATPSRDAECRVPSARVQDLLREAACWRLLGRLFDCPGEAWRRDVATLAGEVDDAGLRAAAGTALETATEGLYHSVFGPGGPAPPREASYHDTLELGSLMSELAGYYAAFGYHPVTSEAPDHVSVEAGFVAYLRFKEAYALTAGDAEHAVTTAEAAERFRRDHLAMFAAPLAAVLADSEIDYLVQASGLLAARVGDPPPRTRLRVFQEPVEDSGSEFPCCDT